MDQGGPCAIDVEPLESPEMKRGLPDDLQGEEKSVGKCWCEHEFDTRGELADKCPQGECDHVNRPLVHVGDVLREAEDIVSDRGAPRVLPGKGAEVLVDEVDVQYSPRRRTRPIEIVVRHNTVVSQANEAAKVPGTAAKCVSRQPFRRLRSPAEGTQAPSVDPPAEVTAVARGPQPKFKKGHRRAFSVPSANGNRMTLAVIDNDELMADGLHKRHIVRYRLHPHRHRAVESRGPSTVDDPMLGVPLFDFTQNDEDPNQLEIEINEEEIVRFPDIESAKNGPRTVIKKFWEARWKVTNFEFLPEWLQDNEYLRTGHRPPLASFGSCFKSIFSLHTETGNIWTHMYGCFAFIGVAAWFLTRPCTLVQWQEKLVLSFFFMGAVACLGMSFAFHTVQCHSAGVGKLFSKLDYTGISLLIIGSFIPWIYYGFHCRPQPMIIYITMICVLGTAAIVVSLWDKFASPRFRALRAGVFVAMGLSSVVPAVHFFVTDGFRILFEQASMHWLLIMGILYIAGAGIYASRIPERCFPGKCDLWFQSHQLFHLFVVSAAFVHFHGITEMAVKRLEQGSCAEQLYDRYGVETYSSILGGWLGLDPT